MGQGATIHLGGRMRRSLQPLLLVGALSICAVANATTTTVSSSSQLNSALSSAARGDVIILTDGTYTGFTVTKSGITIQAAHRGNANITSGIIRLSKVSDVTVQGLR